MTIFKATVTGVPKMPAKIKDAINLLDALFAAQDEEQVNQLRASIAEKMQGSSLMEWFELFARVVFLCICDDTKYPIFLNVINNKGSEEARHLFMLRMAVENSGMLRLQRQVDSGGAGAASEELNSKLNELKGCKKSLLALFLILPKIIAILHDDIATKSVNTKGLYQDMSDDPIQFIAMSLPILCHLQSGKENDMQQAIKLIMEMVGLARDPSLELNIPRMLVEQGALEDNKFLSAPKQNIQPKDHAALDCLKQLLQPTPDIEAQTAFEEEMGNKALSGCFSLLLHLIFCHLYTSRDEGYELLLGSISNLVPKAPDESGALIELRNDIVAQSASVVQALSELQEEQNGLLTKSSFDLSRVLQQSIGIEEKKRDLEAPALALYFVIERIVFICNKQGMLKGKDDAIQKKIIADPIRWIAQLMPILRLLQQGQRDKLDTIIQSTLNLLLDEVSGEIVGVVKRQLFGLQCIELALEPLHVRQQVALNSKVDGEQQEHTADDVALKKGPPSRQRLFIVGEKDERKLTGVEKENYRRSVIALTRSKLSILLNGNKGDLRKEVMLCNLLEVNYLSC